MVRCARCKEEMNAEENEAFEREICESDDWFTIPICRRCEDKIERLPTVKSQCPLFFWDLAPLGLTCPEGEKLVQSPVEVKIAQRIARIKEAFEELQRERGNQ